PRLEPVEALADVREKARLRVFAVRYDLNATLDLLAHTFSDLSRQDRIQLALIIRQPRIFCFQQIEQIVRGWQAADMRRLDVIGILLDGHWCFLRAPRIRLFSPLSFREALAQPQTGNVIGVWAACCLCAPSKAGATSAMKRSISSFTCWCGLR